MSDVIRVLNGLLPPEDELWLCVIYGSAARDALAPGSDIDVLAEGCPDAVEDWTLAAESALGREVNVSSVQYMARQPMMVAQILEAPVVIRDVRGRLNDLLADAGGLEQVRRWQTRMLGDALDEYPQSGPARAFTGQEQRFMEALAGLRSEARRLRENVPDLELQWAAERATRRIRNLLRDWPEAGNHRQPRNALRGLAETLSPDAVRALEQLPYETATADPVGVQLDPRWTKLRLALTPVLDELVQVASAALRRSLA